MVCIFSCSQHTHIPRGLSDRSLAGDYAGPETVCSVYVVSIYVCTFCHVFAAYLNLLLVVSNGKMQKIFQHRETESVVRKAFNVEIFLCLC